MSRNINNIDSLLTAGLIRTEDSLTLSQVITDNAVAITGQMSELIQQEDNDGPISKQFLPSVDELNIATNELYDPTGDRPFSPTPGLIHRYADRVLLKVTSICAVYCRFCFRKEVVGPKAKQVEQELDLDKAIDYISQNKNIREVILSGGDPLVLSAHKLASILTALNEVSHLNMIRLHTRIPVVDSKRITDAVIQSLKISKPVYVVLHCNHPKELTSTAMAACNKFVDNGIPLLSQSVLLKGVNDDLATLKELFYRLTALRIKPYYLHHPDRARGTTHFRVSIEKGRQLIDALRKSVSGLCLPTYILEIPGGHGKIPIGPEYIKTNNNKHSYTLTDYSGEQHIYDEHE